MNNEKLSSRLAFILLSASTAIGLGNVWRFPFIAGKYGGGAFLILYIICLLFIGIPLMVVEFAIGRAAQKSPGQAFEILEPAGSKWHLCKYVSLSACAIVTFYYAVVSGWVLKYVMKNMLGELDGLTAPAIATSFQYCLNNWPSMWIYTAIVLMLSAIICYLGLQKGIEKATKPMMIMLMLFLIAIVIRALTLPNMLDGLKYFLMPNLNRLMESGFLNVLSAAMSQTFYSLSLGFCMLITFGSYIGKERSLTGEAIMIAILDTAVAVMAGLIIFPCCSAFDINPAAGPELLFITLPNVFSVISGGQFWGTLFFIGMFIAALTSIIGLMEGSIATCMDIFKAERNKVTKVYFLITLFCVIPCILGFNLWQHIQPLGPGSTIMDLEDFIVCNNLLPIGSLICLIFAVNKKYGWGWQNLIKEINTGKGIKFPTWSKNYMCYILPLIVLFIFISGYMSFFK